MGQPETEILNVILREFATRPEIRLWRSNVGVATPLYGRNPIRFGIPGQADLTGILMDGRRLEIEVKTLTGRQSDQQASFQRMIEARQGVYILARCTGDVYAGLEAHGVYLPKTPAGGAM